jgi:hypothetical protein
MTGRRPSNVRHIPEEELHAYLDQALSRSQCIEIETHLAVCHACRRDRDAIAALRDRTTRLLVLAAPVGIRAPAWTELEGVALVRRQQRPWRRIGLWAASFAGAVLAGWGLRTISDPHPTALALRQAPAIFAVEPAPTPVQTIAVEPSRPEDPTAAYGSSESMRLVGSKHRLAGPPVALPGIMNRPVSLDAEWTTVTLAEAEEATGGLVPRVSDLPVIQVQLRNAGEGRPVLLVTQSQPSGEWLYTIEGPVASVADLISGQNRPGTGFNSSDPSRSLPDYVESNGSVRRTSRVLTVFGRLPTDSLNALAGEVVLR